MHNKNHQSDDQVGFLRWMVSELNAMKAQIGHLEGHAKRWLAHLQQKQRQTSKKKPQHLTNDQTEADRIIRNGQNHWEYLEQPDYEPDGS